MNIKYRKVLRYAFIFLAQYHILWCLMYPYLWKLPYQAFEQWFALVLLIAAIICFVIRIRKDPAEGARTLKKLRRMCSFEQIFVIALLLWYIIDCAIHTQWQMGSTFEANDWRLFLTWLVAFVYFPFAEVSGAKDAKRNIERIIHTTVLIYGTFCAWVVWKYLHMDYVTFLSGRKLSMTETVSMRVGTNQNITAAHAAVMIALCIYMIATQKKKIRILYVPVCFVFLTVAMLTNSRASYGSALCIIALSVFIYLWKRGGLQNLFQKLPFSEKFSNKLSIRILIVSCIAVAGGLAVFLMRRASFAVLQYGVNSSSTDSIDAQGAMRTLDLSLNHRDGIWIAAVEVLKSSPRNFLLGVLPSNVGQALLDTGLVTKNFPHCHNLLVQVAVSLGVPAMILFIMFLSSLFIRCVRILIAQDKRYVNAWVISIVLLCLVILDVMEAYLFANGRVNLPFFYMFAGWIVALDRSYTDRYKR